MKLRDYSTSLEEKMSEFDLWITPTLGDIRDTPQFGTNLNLLKKGFELLTTVTNNFSSPNSCSSSSLAIGVSRAIADANEQTSLSTLEAICNVLLLATGKTDNNLKCQYPILLRNTYNVVAYPKQTSRGWVSQALPRTLSIDEVTKLIVRLKEKEEIQHLFISSYIHLIVSDETYAKQLWTLGNAYVVQKQSDTENYFLSSMVIFQSRGSITATQGHIPETKLREYMSDWGLKAGFDYNLQDVEIGELLEGIPVDAKVKKRKYDFIIPYQSRNSGAKVFIQSQFYAGDSGSVSHKVVDQTDSSRAVTLRKYPQAVFIEYLDGAGYFSSLNGDLRKMLSKPTTKDFIQIKTAPIKLRRELQRVNFLTNLEIEHAILRSSGKLSEIMDILRGEGYSETEIDFAVAHAIRNNHINYVDSNNLSIKELRYSIVSKYCLLDLLANHGNPIPDDQGASSLIVAGYSHSWGMSQVELVRIALEEVPNIQALWNSMLSPFEDIQWLLDNEFIKVK